MTIFVDLKRKLIACGAGTIFCILCSQPANAGYAIYGEAGLLGVGGGVAYGINEYFSVRAGYSSWSFTFDDDKDDTDISYEMDGKLSGVKALFDWYPFAGGFHVSTGLVANKSELNLSSKPGGGTYTINHHDYTTDEIASIDGKYDLKKTAPYLGIGWGNPVDDADRFTFMFELGWIFQGQPSVNLSATCTASVQTCNMINDDIAVEKADLEDSGLSGFPVITLGLAFRF